MARLCSTDGDADASHCIDCARYTGLTEDDVLDGFCLLLFNVLLCDDGFLLRLDLGFFLCGICCHIDVVG